MANDADTDFSAEMNDFAPVDTGAPGIAVKPSSFSASTPKPAAAKKGDTFNVYTALLLIALLAIIGGTALLALEWGRYDYESEPTMQLAPRSERDGELRDWI
ncbi:MAG: hypothetical protein JNM18_02215 [Planctomycetaceae bacterium]|nr:hypothetical protein [Planctomycetaceae bacterium]